MADTFWKIIKSSKIEIPEIQRDYAQGRIDDRVNEIRKGFVSDLIKAADSGTNFNLDFVFGQSVDKSNQADFNKNKENLEQMLVVLKKFSKETGVVFESKISPKPLTLSEDKLLIPFDGQQRLTTLFLFHLFIGVMAGKDVSLLQNFTYKTRESSSQFINELINNNSVISKLRRHDFNDKTILSKTIKNQSWFFSSWIKDPTVSGMLVTLDEFRNQSIEKSIDFERAWSNLIEKECINFDYFDIQEEGFDEDLYVKMNARGKSLTDFENFTAWLEKKHKNTTELGSNWITNLDKDWLDLFWKTKEKIQDVDSNFLAFFKNIALFSKLTKSKFLNDKAYGEERELVKLLNPESYTPTSKYEADDGGEDIFNIETLKFIFNILDVLASDKNNKLTKAIDEIWVDSFKEKKESFTKLLFTEFNGLNLYHKTFIFSVIKYLEVNKTRSLELYTEEEWSQFKDWLRIARNLIYNARIDDIRTYVPALRALNNLEDIKILNIKKELAQFTLSGEQEKWIRFFPKDQQKEECRKMKFLNSKDEKWQKLIFEAENHFYFFGQINFIFELSEENINKFEDYLLKLKSLFTKETLFSKEYVLQCLFFAFDDKGTWLDDLGTNRFKFYRPFIANSRNRDENWRQIFNDEKKREILKSILDADLYASKDIQAYLKDKKDEIKDWRSLILKKPEVLKNCEDGVFKRENDFNIRLLNKTMPFSTQRELRTYYFYLRQEKVEVKPFEKLRYHSVSKQNESPCAYYDKWIYKDVNYYMDCHYSELGFELLFSRRTEGEIDNEIINILSNEFKFQGNQNELTLNQLTYDNLLIKIEEVIKSLLKLESTTT